MALRYFASESRWSRSVKGRHKSHGIAKKASLLPLWLTKWLSVLFKCLITIMGKTKECKQAVYRFQGGLLSPVRLKFFSKVI